MLLGCRNCSAVLEQRQRLYFGQVWRVEACKGANKVLRWSETPSAVLLITYGTFVSMTSSSKAQVSFFQESAAYEQTWGPRISL